MLTTVQKLVLAFVTLVIGLVLVGQVATVGNTATGYTTETQTMDTSSARWVGAVNVAVINETGGFLNSTGYTLSQSTKCNFRLPIITAAYNATDGSLIAPGNYSLTGNVLKNATDITWDDVLVSYNYTWNGAACGAINESVYFYPTNFYSGASGWRADTTGCSSTDISTSVGIKNASGTTFVDGVDVIINTAGSYTLVNTAKVNGSSNTALVTVSYCPDGYISGWGGTVLNLVPGFFALAILIFSVGMFYSLAKDAGIL